MRKLQWILHGEKDSLNALGEMKLVPLKLSEPPSRRGDWHPPITCKNQIPSSCSSLWKIPVQHCWPFISIQDGNARSISGHREIPTKPTLCPGTLRLPEVESEEKHLPQTFQMLKILAGEKAQKDKP